MIPWLRFHKTKQMLLRIIAVSIFLTLQAPLGIDADTDRSVKACTEFYLPFVSFQNRGSFKELSERSLDGFGAYRKRGHKHAGLDILAGFGETVYPIGRGQIKGIYYKFPYLAVIIEHRLTDGTVLYSSYIHVADILVRTGDFVNENKPIARVFNKDEFISSGFKKNHLHLEIRKTMEDNGRASYSCYTMKDLNYHFYDPTVFLKKHLN